MPCSSVGAGIRYRSAWGSPPKALTVHWAPATVEVAVAVVVAVALVDDDDGGGGDGGGDDVASKPFMLMPTP